MTLTPGATPRNLGPLIESTRGRTTPLPPVTGQLPSLRAMLTDAQIIALRASGMQRDVEPLFAGIAEQRGASWLGIPAPAGPRIVPADEALPVEVEEAIEVPS